MLIMSVLTVLGFLYSAMAFCFGKEVSKWPVASRIKVFVNTLWFIAFAVVAASFDSVSDFVSKNPESITIAILALLLLPIVFGIVAIVKSVAKTKNA